MHFPSLAGLPVYGCYMFQVSDSYEGFVEVVQLQNTRQQEEARYQNTSEELWQGKALQTNRCQPAENTGSWLDTRISHYFSFYLYVKMS